MSIEQGRQARTQSTGEETTSQTPGFVQLAIAAVSFALVIYVVWTIAPMLPVIGPLVSRLTEPTNLLEQVAAIGKSKQADFAKFTDAGGLDAFPSWHGLSVSNIQTSYAPNGTLNQLVLVITGRSKWSPATSKWYTEDALAPPALVRSTLAKVCESDNWQVTETGGVTTKAAEGAKLICTYNKLNDRSNHMLVALEASSTQPTAQPIAAAAPAPAPAVPSAESKPATQEAVLTKQYLEVLKAAYATFTSQGQDGLTKASEDCWNRSGSAASKGDCVDQDIAARQVLIGAGQREPAGPFATDAIKEQLATVSGPGASPALLEEMYGSLNQVMQNLLAQHKARAAPANLATK